MNAAKELLEYSLVGVQDEASLTGEHGAKIDVPQCVKAAISSTKAFVVPASTGLTTAYAFFAHENQNESCPLVILSHGLGQTPCDSQWLWIHSFLKSGVNVLVVALEGHGKSNSSARLDFRQSTRTLPLILDKLLLARQAKPPSLPVDIFLCGHSIGGTYSLLAAARHEFSKLLKGVICITPTISSQASSEMSSQRPSFRHPIQLLKDAVKLIPYYGILGVRRIWRSSESKDMKSKLALASGPEHQVSCFVAENIESGKVLQNLKVPVLWIQGERGTEKWSAQLAVVINQVKSPLLRYSDAVRSHRGIQYSAAWSEKVAEFVVQSLSTKPSQSSEGVPPA